MRKTALPSGVSSIAEDAAPAALECEDELSSRNECVTFPRNAIACGQALADQGWDIHPSHANFVWLRLGERTQEFAQACDAAGITIRAFPDEGVRISVG